MSKKRTAEADYVSLSAEDMDRFHRNAAAAVRRRGGGFVLESLASTFELVVMGGAPIVGLVWFDWSPAQLLVFLLVGMWVGIACDWARLALAGRGVREFAQTHYDDWHVWVVVEALRSGRTTAPRSHLAARHEPGAGVFVDIVAGGVGTAVIAAMVGATGFKDQAGGLFQDGSFLISLASFVAYQALSAYWEIARHRASGCAGPVGAQPGVRGIGLFLLMFVVLMAGDPETRGGVDARRVMLAVNGAIVVIGLLNSAALLWLRRETVWLRNYLRQRKPDASPPAKGRKKRSRA
jgi:hypothetical protein